MFAQIGTTIFEGLFSPESFTMREGENYAKQAVVHNKPRTQHMGSELRQVDITIHLLAAFCTPDAEIAALRSAMEARLPLPFIKGTGQYLGDYLIESMEHEVIDAGSDGSTVEASVTLALYEYVDPDPAAAARRAAANAGFGMAANKPVALTRGLRTRANSGVMMQELANAKVQGGVAADNVALAQAKPSRLAKAIKNAQKAVAAVKNSVAKAQDVLQKAQALQSQAQSVAAQLNQAQRNIAAAQQALTPPVDLNDASVAVARMNATVKNADTAAAPILAYGGARKG